MNKRISAIVLGLLIAIFLVVACSTSTPPGLTPSPTKYTNQTTEPALLSNQRPSATESSPNIVSTPFENSGLVALSTAVPTATPILIEARVATSDTLKMPEDYQAFFDGKLLLKFEDPQIAGHISPTLSYMTPAEFSQLIEANLASGETGVFNIKSLQVAPIVRVIHPITDATDAFDNEIIVVDTGSIVTESLQPDARIAFDLVLLPPKSDPNWGKTIGSWGYYIGPLNYPAWVGYGEVDGQPTWLIKMGVSPDHFAVLAKQAQKLGVPVRWTPLSRHQKYYH